MRTTAWLLLPVLLAGLALRLRTFQGGPSVKAEGNAYVQMARNYGRHGYFSLGILPPVLGNGHEPYAVPRLYTDHPPLLPLLLSFLPGIDAKEAAFRAKSFLAALSLLTVWVLFSLARRLFTEREGLAAALCLALLPAAVHFSTRIEVQGALPILFQLLTILAYARWLDRGGRGGLAAFLAVFAVGALADWPVFITAPLITLHYYLCTEKGDRKKEFLLFPLAALGSWFLLVFFYMAPGFDGLYLFLARTAGHLARGPEGWARIVLLHRPLTYFHPLYLVAAAGGGLRLLCELRRCGLKDGGGRRAALALLPFLSGLPSLLAPAGALRHPYVNAFPAPGVALLAAVGLMGLLEKLEKAFGKGKRLSRTGPAVLAALMVVGLATASALRLDTLERRDNDPANLTVTADLRSLMDLAAGRGETVGLVGWETPFLAADPGGRTLFTLRSVDPLEEGLVDHVALCGKGKGPLEKKLLSYLARSDPGARVAVLGNCRLFSLSPRRPRPARGSASHPTARARIVPKGMDLEITDSDGDVDLRSFVFYSAGQYWGLYDVLGGERSRLGIKRLPRGYRLEARTDFSANLAALRFPRAVMRLLPQPTMRLWVKDAGGRIFTGRLSFPNLLDTLENGGWVEAK